MKQPGIFRILFLLSLLKCSVDELRTVYKVVLRELNHLCVLADIGVRAHSDLGGR